MRNFFIYLRSNDGLMLLVTSSDCYCSIITFEPNELGTPLEASVMFPLMDVSNQSSKSNEVKKGDHVVQQCDADLAKVTSPSMPGEQVVSPNDKPRRIRPTMISGKTTEATLTADASRNLSSSNGINVSKTEIEKNVPIKSDVSTVTQECVSASNCKTLPRRVDFITLSSFKRPTTTQSSPRTDLSSKTESNDSNH